MSEDFRAWIGRETSHSDTLSPAAVEAMAATLDLPDSPAVGDALPPGWQWLFFNPAAPRSGLGPDGHPARGGFLPPIELPRRMWAGSRIRYLTHLPVGAQAQRHSRIANIVNKTGKRGALWFVTVEHTTVASGTPCIVEEQDIVYREPPPPSANNEPAPPYEETAEWSRPFTPDTTLLFRYSALTFNGHRIHYDQAYARNEEGYPDLVVHGPLTATLLQQLALEIGNGKPMVGFDFRGVAPLFVDRPIRLEGKPAEDGSLQLWARGPQGELAMSATARFG